MKYHIANTGCVLDLIGWPHWCHITPSPFVEQNWHFGKHLRWQGVWKVALTQKDGTFWCLTVSARSCEWFGYEIDAVIEELGFQSSRESVEIVFLKSIFAFPCHKWKAVSSNSTVHNSRVNPKSKDLALQDEGLILTLAGPDVWCWHQLLSYGMDTGEDSFSALAICYHWNSPINLLIVEFEKSLGLYSSTVLQLFIASKLPHRCWLKGKWSYAVRCRDDPWTPILWLSRVKTF